MMMMISVTVTIKIILFLFIIRIQKVKVYRRLKYFICIIFLGLTKITQSRYCYYTHFTDRDTKTQGG